MKSKKIIAVTVIILVFTQIFCSACGNTNSDENITLCVYADSRTAAAETVAKSVASVIAEYLRDELIAANKAALQKELKLREESIKAIAESVLRRRGFGYGAQADCSGGTVTVKLGCGNGTAITASYTAEDNSLYKSVIAEIAKK